MNDTSEPKKKTENFQIRWNEALGKPECPYMYRWAFIFFGYSIRVHHWIRSDDKRFFHDHPWSFVTVVLKGSYTDVSPATDIQGVERPFVKKDTLTAGMVKYRAAEHKHYVDVPKGGCWTLLFCGRAKRKWGFWVKANQFFRPLRFFNKFGHPPCHDQ